ncbi:MAG: TIGR02996 domain-containing protein, partial [Proteobacteria bacterium]|nr:TIGR02996 domain-containing protein [Pseudomonadota bacterium]
MKASSISHLAEARTALDEGDLERAIGALPSAWRACRHPRIADLVDRVGAELDRIRGPVPGRTVAERIAAWLVIDGEREPTDVGRLLAEMWPANGKLGLACYARIAAWPDDPRMPRVLAQLPRRGYADRAAVWKSVCARIMKLGDRRIAPELGKLALPRETRRELGALGARPSPSLTAAAEAHLTAMEQHYAVQIRRGAAKARGEPEMLAAIYAAPDDLAIRDVYADWLTEQGDPRGELISLQRARTEGRARKNTDARERELLGEHGARWAEPLTKLLDQRIFENGFVAAGRLRAVTGWRASAKRIDPNAKHGAWRLVRHLDIGIAEIEVDRVLDDLPLLHGLYDVRIEQLAALARGPTRALRELGTLIDSSGALDRCPLPALRALTLASDSALAQ